MSKRQQRHQKLATVPEGIFLSMYHLCPEKGLKSLVFSIDRDDNNFHSLWRFFGFNKVIFNPEYKLSNHGLVRAQLAPGEPFDYFILLIKSWFYFSRDFDLFTQ